MSNTFRLSFVSGLKCQLLMSILIRYDVCQLAKPFFNVKAIVGFKECLHFYLPAEFALEWNFHFSRRQDFVSCRVQQQPGRRAYVARLRPQHRRISQQHARVS